MKTLERKLWRDIWRMKGQLLAIILVVAAGIATFVSSMGTYSSLHVSQMDYYDVAQFSDLFVSVSRAPESVRERLARVPGVTTVETRIVEFVSLDVPGAKEPATGQFVSIPSMGEPAQNKLTLTKGRWPEPRSPDEILVNEGFARAHHLQPGDSVSAVMNGRKTQLRVVGIALSPEFIYVIPPGAMMPNDAQFGIMWMRRDVLASSFDRVGSFNHAVMRIGKGENKQEIIRRVDLLLGPYGGQGAYGRHRQTSHRYLSDEIRSLQATGVMMPIIFLGIAAFLIHVLLARLIETQREQIATMLALGYRPRELAVHFSELVLVVGLSGGVVGTALGAWLGRGMTSMYTRYFHLPKLVYVLSPALLSAAMFVGVASAAVGVVGVIWRAVNTPPADGMRPVAPAVYRQTIVERLGLQKLLPLTMRMVLRNLQRRPVRFSLSVIGIAFAVSTLVLGWYFNDSMEAILHLAFEKSYRDDISVAFASPTPEHAIDELRTMPGVQLAEGYRAVSVRVIAGPVHRNIALMGVPPGSRLRKIVDDSGRSHEVADDSLLLTDKLGEVLGVKPGDTLLVRLQESERRTVPMVVRGFVSEPMGVFAYTTLDTAQRLVRERSLSGAWLMVDESRDSELVKLLQDMPTVASVTRHEAAVRSFRETTQEYMSGFTAVLVLFAVIIVVGVVYNNGRISVAEHQRDLASLRVLGFTRAEVSWILLGELGVQVVMALPVGLLLGYGIAYWVSAVYDTELYRFPLTITIETYTKTAVVLLLSGAATALLVRRKIDKLDMIEVLKTRE